MSKAKVHYHDIGDYHNREDKLAIVKKFGRILNPDMNLRELEPNEHGDWISMRNDLFENFLLLGDKEEKSSFFISGIYCRGVEIVSPVERLCSV